MKQILISSREQGDWSMVFNLPCPPLPLEARAPKNQHKDSGDFPGGPVVKHPPASKGDTGSIPGARSKIPHIAEQPELMF